MAEKKKITINLFEVEDELSFIEHTLHKLEFLHEGIYTLDGSPHSHYWKDVTLMFAERGIKDLKDALAGLKEAFQIT